MIRSPKLLKCSLNIGTTLTTSSWNATVTGVVTQQHPGYTDPVTTRKYYDARDVVNGDYIATTSSGKCLKITNISNQTDVGFSCVLVDELEINRSVDPAEDAKISSPANGYIFEIKNNLPVLYPLPSGLEAGFNYTFASQLLSRFISVYGVGAGADALTTASYDVANGVPKLNASAKLDVAKLSGLTKASVGLPNVDDTSDINKPVSTAVQNALSGKIDAITRGAANGVAPLGPDGLIPSDKIPGGSLVETVSDFTDLPNIGISGKFYVVTSQSKIYLWSGSEYIDLTTDTTNLEAYEYIAVTTSGNISNKQVVSVMADNLVLTLPIDPPNGTEIIIINTNDFSFDLLAGGTETINGDTAGIYKAVSGGDYKHVYLVYINDWKVNKSIQSVNVNTSAEARGSDYYWPGNTNHNITEETVYGTKQAFIETWTNSQDVNLAQQITIFNDYANSDNYDQIWHPVDGESLRKTVTFSASSILSLPAISYNDDLLFTVVKLIGLNWREYVAFNDLFEDHTNFLNIIGNANILNIISANSNFLLDFITASERRRFQFPAVPMIGAGTLGGGDPTTLAGRIVTGTTTTTATNLMNIWKMFDGSLDTYWESTTGSVTNQDIGIVTKNEMPLYPHTIKIRTSNTDPSTSPKRVALEYKDVDDWIPVAQFILDSNTIEHEFKIIKPQIQSDTWKVKFLDTWGSTTTMRVHNLELIGWNASIV